MYEIMIDLETMGNGPNAAILAIGAVEFDRHLKTIGQVFYINVDLKSAVALGGVIDPDTVMWWMKQSDQSRSAFKGAAINMAIALTTFSQWLHGRCEKKKLLMWGCGSDFDNVILASAYRNCGLELPWDFWNNRCYRTMKAMNPHVKMERSGTYHNALDDARSQAEHLLRILG